MRNAISLAYEYAGSRLFYSDIQRGSINTVHFNGTGHRVLVEQVGAVEGMVFGASTGTLYWTCNSAPGLRAAPLGELLRAAREGRAARVSTVLRLPRGDRPRGVDFEPCERRLYWTNWNESHPSIQRAYTSGRELQTIVATDILMPNGLALDHAAKHVYWADARLDKIERMHYDGSHRAVVTRASTEHPFDLALAGDWVFWTDWLAHGVYRADKRAGGASALRRDVPRPMAVVAVTPDHQTCESTESLYDDDTFFRRITIDLFLNRFVGSLCGSQRWLRRVVHARRERRGGLRVWRRAGPGPRRARLQARERHVSACTLRVRRGTVRARGVSVRRSVAL